MSSKRSQSVVGISSTIADFRAGRNGKKPYAKWVMRQKNSDELIACVAFEELAEKAKEIKPNTKVSAYGYHGDNGFIVTALLLPGDEKATERKKSASAPGATEGRAVDPGKVYGRLGDGRGLLDRSSAVFSEIRREWMHVCDFLCDELGSKYVMEEFRKIYKGVPLKGIDGKSKGLATRSDDVKKLIERLLTEVKEKPL